MFLTFYWNSVISDFIIFYLVYENAIFSTFIAIFKQSQLHAKLNISNNLK